jgi:hypothetical protein
MVWRDHSVTTVRTPTMNRIELAAARRAGKLALLRVASPMTPLPVSCATAARKG